MNFTDNSTSATSWAWTFGDAATSSSASPSHTYIATNGIYLVCLTVTAANNCTDTYCDSVGTGSMAISTLASAGIEVYPNPANDHIFITADAVQIEGAKIFDLTGRKIAEWKLSSSSEIDRKSVV